MILFPKTMSALTPLSPGAQDFRDLLGMRVHSATSRFYCGAPTACDTLLSLEDSLMWRDTLEIWHKSKNLLDSAIYKWAAAMLCDKHYGNEEVESQLWKQIKSRMEGSRYASANGAEKKKVAVWPEMKATTEEVRTLKDKLAEAERKLAGLAGERKKLAGQLRFQDDDLAETMRLRNAAEQLAAEKEGALVELRCRHDDLKSNKTSTTKQLGYTQPTNGNREVKFVEASSRIESLEKVNKELGERLDENSHAMAEANGTLKELRTQNIRLTDRNKDLLAQVKDVRDTIARQDSAMTRAEALSDELREENKSLRQFEKETMPKLAEQDATVRELRRENKELKDQYATISNQLVTAQRAIGGHEKDIERSKAEMERSITERDDSLKDLFHQVEKLTQQSKKAIEQANEYRRLNLQQDDQLRLAHEEAGDSLIAGTKAAQQVKDLEAQLKESQEGATILRSTIRDLSYEVKDLEAKLDDSAKEITDLNVEKNSLTDQLSDAEARINAMESSSASSSNAANQDLEKSRAETTQANTDNEALSIKVKDLEAELKTLQSQMDESRIEKTSLTEHLSKLEVELDRAKSIQESASQTAQKDLEETKEEATQLHTDNASLSAEIKDLQDQLRDETARYEAASKELDRWQAENEEQNAENQELSNQVARLKNENDSRHEEFTTALEEAKAATQHAEARIEEVGEDNKNLVRHLQHVKNENKKLLRQLEILKSELNEEKARHTATLGQVEKEKAAAREKAAREMERAIIEQEAMGVSPGKRHSRVWKRLSSQRQPSSGST